ncbi:hypothetical protein AMIS_76650 [Actinoplanes missouriensis 431]|uniref:Uncharacterized protein n=1 Tax=Actinoplanes missouriensis (strain ATCC 14538 / DSM 43046 / CBS 188.64 / JCM 3121 / NBRC 102363 / NCIMB 12654 / NRRL B-3342 / UNCC 431) TaxID=512565 RepID=I0HIP8_ACTM4|nr:hypothetical protein [Actinoplanes missouriensis]BAL92885.1 hypothetical protein AMIS_76650 [Actinoplanes missouriensis 431]
MIAGLPFAVATGWALGAPEPRPAAIGATGETSAVDGLGTAPASALPDRGTTGGYRADPPRASAAPVTAAPTTAPTAGPAVTMTVTVVTSVPPPVVTSSTSAPQLTAPPVPTPTQVTDPPSPTTTSAPPASATPDVSASPSSASAFRLFRERLAHRWYPG